MGEIEDRHKDCFADKKHAEMISTSSLAICRQVHNEARNMFYTTNTFAFSQITNINQFVNYLQNSGCGHHLVIRRVHLKIMIERFHDEKDWKIAITQCLILRLPAVHRISINLTLLYSTANVVVSRTPAEFEARQLPGDSGNNLMSALLELGKLPLSRMTFVMSKRWFYCWTLAEKQTWARYIKDSVLRKDNQT